MFRIAVASLALAAAIDGAAAAGWVVQVDDSQGFRTVALRGESAEDSEHGVAVMCSPGAVSSIAFSSGPARDFSVLPGADVEIRIGSTVVARAIVQRNDSVGVVAWGDVDNLPELLESFAAAGEKVSLGGALDSAVIIPGDGLAGAIGQVKTACLE